MEQKKLSKTSKIILISILVLAIILIAIVCVIVVKIKNKQDKNKQASREYVLIAEQDGDMYGSKVNAKIEIRFQDNKLHEKFTMTLDDSFYCSLIETGLKENGIKASFVGDNKIVLEDIEAEKFNQLNSLIVTESELREMFEKEYTEQEMEELLIICEYSFKQNGYKILTEETENLEDKYEILLNGTLINNKNNKDYSWKQDVKEDNNNSIDSEDDYLNTPRDFLNEKSYNEWFEDQDRLIDDMEETKKLLDSIQNSN